MNDRRRGAIAGSAVLDDLDRAIVEALQADGRASFREIARALGVAEGTVRNRYDRLSEAGVLDVVGVTNPLALGFDAMAMVGVTTSGRPQVVSEPIAELTEVSYVVIVAGQFDLLVEVVCRDHAHLLEIIEQLRAIDGVVSTDTFVYLKLTKQSFEHGRLPGR
ncbi:Lrp/AsnC family transcriptional regulator [Conexibacter stalactiti]|uniref:Lrp/AsnC family transcriptional regulator n=1 Tax=Conexibacter stalactiti TaxID=1940611 RepID=A0ABU4HUE5_9ACTN|nr:Lrp/AsnC family transcriptional regulator [Conexibacter stalactiti]MDW5596444.1 Lrp/AsnC family transcriptional regulator [Conexibacter stalactiti]MEC5037086.1 Lrp/AsnC family transcriptional regulator [Conexibacter stalactiti]